MSNISHTLLLSDPSQAALAPSVLEKTRVSEIDLHTYFTILAQDAAQNLTAKQWAEKLEQKGCLSISRICWMASGITEADANARIEEIRPPWVQKTNLQLEQIKELIDQNRDRLDVELTKQVDQILFEVELLSQQNEFDLAQERLQQVQAQLEQPLNEIFTYIRQSKSQLKEEHQKIRKRLAGMNLISGPAGNQAAAYLLVAAEKAFNAPQPDLGKARQCLELAQALCDGAELDLYSVAMVLRQDYDKVKAQLEAQTGIVLNGLAKIEVKESINVTSISPTTSRVQEIDPQQRQRQEQSSKIQYEGNLARTKHLFPQAENYFKRSLQLWPGNETAAKNFATMLKQLGRTSEAISVLEKAVPYAQEQLPIFNLLTNYYTDTGKYSKARNFGQRALRLCGDATAEIGVLTSLTTLEVKAGNIHQALEYCDAILRLNPKHEHFRKERKRLEAVLSGISTDVHVESSLDIQPEVSADHSIEVSPLLQEDLDRCELTKATPKIIKSGKFNQLVSEAERLYQAGIDWNPKQYREKADYFLQAAKVLLLATRGAESDNNLNERLETYLNYYMGVTGDYLLLRNNLDSARDYYLEHLRLFKRKLPLATIRRIASYFQTFIPGETDLSSFIHEERSPHRRVPYIIGQTIKLADKNLYGEIARGALEIACVSDVVADYIANSLKAEQQIKSEFQPLTEYFRKQVSPEIKVEDLSDVFRQAVLSKRLATENQENQLSYLVTIVGERGRLLECDLAIQRISADFQPYWNQADRQLFGRFRDLAREVNRYFEESRFEDKEFLAGTISNSADTFTAALNEGPTYLGRAYFSRLVYRLRRLVEEEHRKLRQVSLPELSTIVVKTTWVAPNQILECHLEIANKGDSAAQNVVIRILESEANDYVSDHNPHSVSSIYARPHSVTTAFPVEIKPEALEKEAIDLRINLEYYDRENLLKTTDPIRLRLPLREEEQFTEIENPYRTGLPVTENDRTFFGRDNFVDDLVRELTRPERTSAIVVYGQKRSGKTSILRQAEISSSRSQKLRVVPVYFSMQTVLMAEEDIVPGMFFLIADEIGQKCDELGLEQVGHLSWQELVAPPGPSLQFRLYLDRIRHITNVRLILIIDEFTELSNRIDEGRIDKSIMKYLKSLIEQGYFSCLLSGIDNMPQVLKKYSNELAVSDPRRVGYLEHDDAVRLIEEPIRFRDNRSRFISRQVVDEIVRLTAGSPFYIQFVCHRLVDYLNRTKNPTVTGADVDRVVDELIQGPTRLDPFTKFDNLLRYKEDDTRDTRETILEGLFLYLLADETRTRRFAPFGALRERASFVNESDLIEIANQLEERQVVESVSSPGRQYRIVVDLFRRWINSNRNMDTEALSVFQAKLERLST